MKHIPQLTVRTNSSIYQIYFSSLNHLYQEVLLPILHDQVVIVTNPIVGKLYRPDLSSVLENAGIKNYFIEIPDGEYYKNQHSLHLIYDFLLTYGIQRSATLIALGGGVIGDLTGFAAATYQRGVRFIQIPTTLLAQVDASIGGKTAINHRLGKNMIGAFYQPQAVLIGEETLSTLSKRELASGIAEIIKYALLGDRSLFDYLEKHMIALNALQKDVLEHVLYTCCAMKADIVQRDEKEQSIRALLNLGHTFAHVIEQQTGYQSWLHGEAVAVGLCLATKLSWQRGDITQKDYLRLEQLIQAANLPTQPPRIPFVSWLSTIKLDKKSQAGKTRFILLKGIGQAYVDETVNEKELRCLLQELLT